MRWTRQRLARNGIAGQVERFVSDQQHADERRLQRTAKSCGPDAPTLASSSRMLCRPQPGADKTSVRGRRWQESPVTEESTKETVKTIACGNAGRFRCTRCCSCAFYRSKCTRGCGCSGHPAFPTPSWGRKIHQRLGRIAPRERGRMQNYIRTRACTHKARMSALAAQRILKSVIGLPLTQSGPQPQRSINMRGCISAFLFRSASVSRRSPHRLRMQSSSAWLLFTSMSTPHRCAPPALRGGRMDQSGHPEGDNDIVEQYNNLKELALRRAP